MQEQARHILLHKIRQSQVKKILQGQREKVNELHNKQLHEQFMRHFPHVSDQSYEQHKSALAAVVWNPQYSYQIVCIANVVAWFLIQHQYDRQSIKILKFISEYSQCEIPQTHTMAQTLLKILQKDNRSQLDGFIITANLATSPKNNLLLSKLIQLNLTHLISNIISIYKQTTANNPKQINRNDDVSNYYEILVLAAEILCVVLSMHSCFDLSQLGSVCTLLVDLCVIVPEGVWCLVYSLADLRKSHKPNKKYAKLLLSEFSGLLIKQQYGLQLQIMDFLIYAAHSDAYTTNANIIEIVRQTGFGKNGISAQTSALQLGYLYEKECVQIWQIRQLWRILHRSGGLVKNKQQILQLMLVKKQQQIIESVWGQDIQDEVMQLSQQQVEQIWQMLIQLIEVRSLQKSICELLLVLVQQQGIRHKLESKGLPKILGKVYSQKDGYQCQQLEALIDAFQLPSI